MSNLYESELRLFDPEDAVGKTLVRVDGFSGGDTLFQSFDDGSFLFACAEHEYEEATFDFYAHLSMESAHKFGLVSAADFAAWKDRKKAEREREEMDRAREEFKRLKALLGGDAP